MKTRLRRSPQRDGRRLRGRRAGADPQRRGRGGRAAHLQPVLPRRRRRSARLGEHELLGRDRHRWQDAGGHPGPDPGPRGPHVDRRRSPRPGQGLRREPPVQLRRPRSRGPRGLRGGRHPLADLLAAVDAVDDGGPVRELVDTLVSLTTQTGPIAIPNLAVTIDPDGAAGEEFSPTRLTLGRTFARIGGPAHDGVFRSHSVPLDLNLLGVDASSLRSDAVKSIACEGSRGETVRRSFPDIGLADETTGLGLLLMEDARAEFSGTQFRSGRIVAGRRTDRPRARGTMRTTIAELAIPQAGVALTDRVTSVRVNTQRLVKRNGVRTYTRWSPAPSARCAWATSPTRSPPSARPSPSSSTGARGPGVPRHRFRPHGKDGPAPPADPLPRRRWHVLRMVIGEASMHVARKS